MPLIDDGHLIGFWPFNEPSGTPFFRNHADNGFSKHPSGISFDFQVANIGGAAVDNPKRSEWPGIISVVGVESGTTYTGYMAQGTIDVLDGNSGPTNKYLILGDGGFPQRNAIVTPAIIGSGFTLGFWVNPQNDGGADYQIPGFVNNLDLLRDNCVIGQHHGTDGLCISVSGRLTEGAQFDVDKSSPLTAFASALNGINGSFIQTPLESYRYTHITYQFEYVDGTSNIERIFKDGVLEATQTTAEDLSDTLSTFSDKVLTIGGSHVSTTSADNYTFTTGWGHLISGVYAFNRVLTVGEISTHHNEGGFQPAIARIPEGRPVTIDDPSVILYNAGFDGDFVDYSQYGNNLLTDFQASVANTLLQGPGPLSGIGWWHSSSNAQIGLATGSGVIQSILDGNGSFTIGCWHKSTRSVDAGHDHVFSFGHVGTGDPATVDLPTGGFLVRVLPTTNAGRYEANIFHAGDPNTITLLSSNSSDIFINAYCHVALAYDEQTNGVAFYVNGELAESGVMPDSMIPQIRSLAFSGHPIIFNNGNDDSNDIDDFIADGGEDCWIGQPFIMTRPATPQEIRHIAASGMDTSQIMRTTNDRRLRGYWKCTDSTGNNSLLRDRSGAYKSKIAFAGDMTLSLSGPIWDEIEATDYEGQHYKVEPFRNIVDQDLGATSGVFTVLGGGRGVFTMNTARLERLVGSTTQALRYRMSRTDSDNAAGHVGHAEEMIWSFEVTPSGTIPITYDAIDTPFNSVLIENGEQGIDDRLYTFLTSFDAVRGSGVSLVWMGRNANATPNLSSLASGTVPYGVTSRVLLHARPLQPHIDTAADDAKLIEINMYVDGLKVFRREIPGDLSYLFPDSQLSSDDWVLSIGGSAFDYTTNRNTHSASRAGLGEIFMKNVFVMGGRFYPGEVELLSANGIIDSTPVVGYTDDNVGDIVDTGDNDLLGYWRFTGVPNNLSGIVDLTFKGNDLDPLAQKAAEDGTFNSTGDNSAYNLRYLPGPLGSGSIPTQASGISYKSNTPAAGGSIAPFAISGSAFNNPNNGFSVGFWMVRRDLVDTGEVDTIVSYGPVPSISTSTSFVDASWAVIVDETENIRLLLSRDGALPYDDTLVDSIDIINAGAHGGIVTKDAEIMETFHRGAFESDHIDGWNHYLWSYNQSLNELNCYVNGSLVDRAVVDPSGFHVPLSQDARMITILQPQVDTPWNFTIGDSENSEGPIITDLFYFSRGVTASEARFIAVSGIQLGISPPQGSGLFGGYTQGQNTGSGIAGGFIFGEIPLGSGQLGAYIQGINDGSGLFGGYMQGQNEGSGVIGGFMFGVGQGSGLTGGFVIGSLSGAQEFDAGFIVEAFAAEDFDALIEVQRTAGTDFDAKIVVFEEEFPPDIDIPIPPMTVSGLMPTFCQYFVGSGNARQGKTIDIARWDFGDFTSTKKVSASGTNNDLYPTQHCFGISGYYITRFTLIDSNGIHNQATRIIDAASGISPVLMTVSGVPTAGNAPLSVQFTQTVEALPDNVIIVANLLDFGDGTKTTTLNTRHTYTEPGRYIPIWIVRDSRGVVWSDTISPGIDVS